MTADTMIQLRSFLNAQSREENLSLWRDAVAAGALNLRGLSAGCGTGRRRIVEGLRNPAVGCCRVRECAIAPTLCNGQGTYTPVAFAEALHFPNADGSASLMDPSAVPFATPCSSEVAVTELPFDALLVDLPPVSAIASEKLPPVAVALALPRPFTSASAKLLSPVALECALPFPAELAKHSLPSTPLWSILLLFFTAHPAPAAACARAVANV